MSGEATRPLRTLAVGAAALALGFALGIAGRGVAPGGETTGEPLDAESMRVAMIDALREPHILDRSLALDALLAKLDDENVAGAEAALDAIIVGVDDCDVEAYLHARAAFDPRGAFDHALRWPSVHKRGLGAKAVAHSWAYRGGALEVQRIIASLTAKPVREAAHVGLVSGWARSEDVDGATRYLAQLSASGSKARNNLSLTLLTSTLLSQQGPEALFAWFEGLPDDVPVAFREAAFQNALHQASFVVPEQALAFWQEHADEPVAKDSLWRVAVGWQRSAPETALDWLVAREPGPERNEALTRALRRWHSRDAGAARQWLARADLSDEPRLHRALRRIARVRGDVLPWDES